MTRLLSAAGVAVYVAAVSTAFPSVQEAGASLGIFAPAIAAEAGTESGTVEAGTERAEAAESIQVASTTSTWDTDRDGMLMNQVAATQPFDVLN